MRYTSLCFVSLLLDQKVAAANSEKDDGSIPVKDGKAVKIMKYMTIHIFSCDKPSNVFNYINPKNITINKSAVTDSSDFLKFDPSNHYMMYISLFITDFKLFLIDLLPCLSGYSEVYFKLCPHSSWGTDASWRSKSQGEGWSTGEWE